MRGTRPDIANAISVLSRQVHRWSEGADLGLERLVSYLAFYPARMVYQCPAPDFMIGFESINFLSDADLGGDLTSSRSCGGDLTFLRFGETAEEQWLVSWTSKLLANKCTSTPWSEMCSLQRGLQSSALPASHLCELISRYECPIRARQDNAAVIQSLSLGYSMALRYLARHSRLSITSLHALFKGGANIISYIESGENTSDLMTKSLPELLHWKHTLNLGLVFV